MSCLRCACVLAVWLVVSVSAASEPGFVPMCNGTDLTGWEGLPGWWTVRDGILTAESTAEKPCARSHYLYWTGGEPADFDMRCRFRISAAGNSGIQFRSQRRPAWDTWGYQADMDGAGAYVGCLYQHERGLVAQRGQKVHIDGSGAKSISTFADSAELLQVVQPQQWNTYRVLARGPHISLWINDVLMCEVEDHQPRLALSRGIIALQMHQGPPMKIEYQDLRIRIENPFFAMDTGARGGPDEVVPLLAELGYAGLGGSPATAAAMAGALEQRGLKLFNVYVTLKLDDAAPALTDALRNLMDDLQGRETALWIAVSEVKREGQPLPKSSPDGDAVVLAQLGEVADYASDRNLQIAFYPHAGFWLERFEDAVRLAELMNRPNVGSTFNLCHWLKVEGDRDPAAALAKARPRLFFVSINGADAPATQEMGWDRLIQTLDRGAYDVAKLLSTLRQLHYAGPIGLQAYGVPGDQRENLERSMRAWTRLNGGQ